MRAIIAAIGAAVRQRRVQSLVVAVVVLLSSSATMLALGLLVASSAPFDQAFQRQQGAHATVSVDPALVDAAALAATANEPGVTATAGPFDAVLATLAADPNRRPASLVVGRAEHDSTVDRLNITDGSWLTGPGQIVLSRDRFGEGMRGFTVGAEITVDVPGQPRLRVVGIADSVTGTADAWVWPTQTDVLHADGAITSRQMLYRFATAATDSDIRTAVARATTALPDAALNGLTTYLTAQLRAEEHIAPMGPFVIAFGVLGLVLSVLIVINMVAGAIVAGFRGIGVRKAIGFTPAQIVAVYAGQILAVCVPVVVLGVALGRLAAAPLLGETAQAYGLSGSASIPLWADLAVLLGVPMIVGAAAVGTAVRAARLPAVQAITIGRAPRPGRGLTLRRAVAGARLPHPVGLGLAAPIARPARAAVTLIAVLLGATAVVFATGLATSLTRVHDAFSRAAAVPVIVELPPAIPPGGREPAVGPEAAEPAPVEAPLDRATMRTDPAAVRAAILAAPATASVVGAMETEVQVAGVTEPVQVTAYDGDASWTGYPLIAGRWYERDDEVVASSRTLYLTGAAVGDVITISTELGTRRVRVVGEVFSGAGQGALIMSMDGLVGLVESVTPDRFEVGLTTGTDEYAYVETLADALDGQPARALVTAEDAENQTIAIMLGLIATLTTALAALAALGVLNTATLDARERIHQIGVLKALGMTPHQVRLLVVMSMVPAGLVGGALAIPLGIALHQRLIPVIARAAGTNLPTEIVDVYRPLPLLTLATAGLILVVLGALGPAAWAARTTTGAALRAE
jgi:ABC-type antimicrobial peptide transport system, permease component